MKYQANQIVYIPGHGLGVFKSYESRAMGDSQVTMLAFDILSSGIKVLIPEGGHVARSLREPMNQDAALEVLKLLDRTPEEVDSKPNYKKWNNMVRATIQSGDTKALALMVTKLNKQRSRAPLGLGEQKLLDSAKGILRAELEFALGGMAIRNYEELLAA